MNIFHFLNECKLETKHFNEKIEFYIDKFLPKNLITMIYADGGQGKSYLSLCLAKKILENKNTKVYYLDFDNPIAILKDRKVDELVCNNENMNYIQRGSLNLSAFELLLRLEDSAVGKTYENCVFIVDSLRNFTDITNDVKTMRVMDAFMNIREAGGTVILLHHANKDGKNYQGSNNIKNSIDCMYQLKKHHSCDNEINITLSVKKERAGIEDIGFTVNINTLTIKDLDIVVASMNEYEENFVTKAKQFLKFQNLNKTQLLNSLGFKKDDKTARDVLDKFDGVFWFSYKKGNVYTYSLTTSTTSTTTQKDGGVDGVLKVLDQRSA